MSQSIRLNDSLIKEAKKSARLFDRSPPQQIEHWARLGRVMEAALSYPVREKAARIATRSDLDAALAAVESPEGKARARAVITRTSGRKVGRV
ncbi:MAG: TA system antitoxin ParD family protein [Terrimicrobiaceae bacterium]